VTAEEEEKRNERREKKWDVMMQSWDTTSRRRQKLVLNRLRKGLPDTMRGTVWPLLGGVQKKMREGSATKGIYTTLLRQCEEDNQNALDHMPPEGPNKSMTGLSLTKRSNSFQNIQETIERDIHRTYPRHSMFYDEENHKDDLPPEPKQAERTESLQSEDDDDDSQQGLGGLCGEDLTNLMRELDVGGSSPSANDKKKPAATKKADDSKQVGGSNGGNNRKANPRESQTCETIVESKGGQGMLRRVLCAYSYYDRDVGYCQGMNFIAAMFITIMPEEEAFWMVVSKLKTRKTKRSTIVENMKYHVLLLTLFPLLLLFLLSVTADVMNESPCRLRGLFGKGMTETHKVLHVAEKLIHHFLPKLAKHLDKENVHVTMYATQWLLTQYTSSFNFDLVTRVWDCFLVEGFKTIYRVMLALLQQAQPTLLKQSFEEILGFFRDLPDQVDGNSVMETALKIPLKRKHIARYESEWFAQQNNKS